MAYAQKSIAAPEYQVGSSFFDEVRAASGSGRILLSEDLPLRLLAETEYGVRGCWLQVVLMVATDQGHISNQEYADAIIELIDLNEEFISVPCPNDVVIICCVRDMRKSRLT